MSQKIYDADLINPLGVVTDVNGVQGDLTIQAASSRVTITTDQGAGTISIDATGGVSSVNGQEGAITIDTSVGLSVESLDGTVTLSLEPATTVAIGGIIIGNGLVLTEGSVANVDWTQLPIATDTVLGGVKVPAAATSGLSIDTQGNLTFANNVATTTALGVVKVGDNLTVEPDGTLNADAAPYTLPPATTTTLGGVIVGSGLAVNGSGVLSNTYTYTLPIATASVLGGVKVGSGINVTADGTISNAYALPIATTSSLGGVIVGNRLTVLGDGTVNVPIASSSVLGVVKAGANITIAGDGTISSAAAYTLPIATASTLGGIRIGSGLTIDSGTGVVTASGYNLPIASASTLGGIRVGANLSIDGGGVLSGTYTYTLPPATATILGGVKVGSGLTVGGDGTLSADAGAINPYINVTAQSGASAAGASNGSIAIGGNTQTNTSVDAIAVGSNATTNGNNAVAIGQGSSAAANNAVALGPNTSVTAQNAVAIGSNSATATADTVSFGTPAAKRTLTNVAAGDSSGEVIVWDQVATASSRGLVQIGTGLSVDASGVISVSGGSGGAVDSVNGKTGAVTIADGLGISIDNSGANIVITADVIGINSKTGNVAVTGGSGITIDNTGAGVVVNAAVTDAPMDGLFYARKDASWAVFVPSAAAVQQVTSSGATFAASIVQDDGSTGDHIAVLKALKPGANITIADQGDALLISASVLTSVASVNGQTPDVGGNVTLTATNVNALARDGTNAASGNINFGGFRGINGADPVNPQDFVTLAFLDTITIDPGTF